MSAFLMDGLRVLVSVGDGRIRDLFCSVLRERGHRVIVDSPRAVPRADVFELDVVVVQDDLFSTMLEMLRADRYGELPLLYVFVAEPSLERMAELSTLGASGFLFGETTPERLFAELLGIETRATERIAQRARARKTAEALLSNRAKSDAILNALPDLMFRVSRTGEYLDYRAEDSSKLAISEDQILGSTVHEVLPAPVADKALAAIQRALSTMDVELLEYSLDMPMGQRDFEARIVASNPDEAVVLVRDVTERKQLAAQLAMADRLSALGTLIAGMAHEINNPLTYVLIGIDAALRELEKYRSDQPMGPRMPVILQRLRDALSGAQRVRRIVGELKVFARGGDAPPQPIDVRRVLDQVCAMVHDEVYARGELIREYGATPQVSCNEDLLIQVFLHILLNATQALSSDRSRNSIRVTTHTSDVGRAVVQVIDTGHGIAPSDLDKIFDPFFTTKPLGVGTGLGLWMSQAIVARYGGSIQVDSSAGRGACVTIELPASLASDSDEHEIGSPPGLAPGARVLVIDEDPRSASLLSGFRVTQALSGRDAEQRLASGEDYDVVLCDLLLPDQTGIDLYERVVAQTPELAERFVFMTNDTFTPAIRAFLSRVPNVCVSKPIGSAALEDVLRRRDND